MSLAQVAAASSSSHNKWDWIAPAGVGGRRREGEGAHAAEMLSRGFFPLFPFFFLFLSLLAMARRAAGLGLTTYGMVRTTGAARRGGQREEERLRV